jgi:predicted dehydrogenase
MLTDINAGTKNGAFRWAIAGYGRVAVAHTEGIIAAGHRLAGFSTTNSRTRFGDATHITFNIGPTTGRLFTTNGMAITKTAEDLVNAISGKADGVIVCVPTHRHITVAKMFGIAGFPCLIEKPLAGNVREAREILDFFKNKVVPVAVAHVLPAFPEYGTLRSTLLRRGLADVTSLTMRRFVPWQETDDENANIEKGGAACDLLVHDLHLLGSLSDPEEVICSASTERHGLHQSFDLTVKLRDAQVPFRVMGGASSLYPQFHHSYEVTFSDGKTLSFDGATVTGHDVEPKSVGEIFSEELEIAAAYFSGKRLNASFMEGQGALNALIMLEAAVNSARKKR